MKNCPQQPFGLLQPNRVPNGPWEIISIDLITQLPHSGEYNAICVVIDRLTKRTHFFPITNNFSAKDLAKLLYDRVYPLHGLPLQIISDRGVQLLLRSSKSGVGYLELNQQCLLLTIHKQMVKQSM